MKIKIAIMVIVTLGISPGCMTEKQKSDMRTSAFNKGFEKGKDQWYSVGFKDGQLRGMAEGDSIGYARGVEEGIEIGKTEGIALGDSLGVARAAAEYYRKGRNHEFKEHVILTFQYTWPKLLGLSLAVLVLIPVWFFFTKIMFKISPGTIRDDLDDMNARVKDTDKISRHVMDSMTNLIKLDNKIERAVFKLCDLNDGIEWYRRFIDKNPSSTSTVKAREDIKNIQKDMRVLRKDIRKTRDIKSSLKARIEDLKLKLIRVKWKKANRFQFEDVESIRLNVRRSLNQTKP